MVGSICIAGGVLFSAEAIYSSVHVVNKIIAVFDWRYQPPEIN